MHKEDKINTTSGVSQLKKAPKDMLQRVRCKTRHTIILLSERSRRKQSGLCKSERRTGNEMTSNEKILNTEACNPEAQSLIGKKKPQWLDIGQR